MSEPTAEHLKVAQEWLEKRGGSLEGPLASQSYGWVEVSDENVASLAALLASTYTSGAQWMLEAVRESLRQYPDGGGDIEVMAEVKRLLAEVETLRQRVAELEAAERELKAAALVMGSPKDAHRLADALSYVLRSYRQRGEAAEAEVKRLKQQLAEREKGACKHGYPATVRCSRCGE